MKLLEGQELKKFLYLLNSGNLFVAEGKSQADDLVTQTTDDVKDISNQFYKDYKAIRKDFFNHLIEHNSEIDKLMILEKTQKILDRFIFVLFAEDTQGLLPNNISKDTYKLGTSSRDRSDQRVWREFRNLFQDIDEGRHDITPSINKYNGGLFAKDDILDNLNIKDSIWAHLINLSEYDFESTLDVNILGHIFEQSINDLEELKATVVGEYVDLKKTKRKKDGIFCTPEYIKKYIVENTVGRWLEENPDRLTTIKILDPACGSGAFLNQAHTYLVQEYESRYQKEIDQKSASGQNLDIFTINPAQTNRSILLNNLYGVDLQPESVEISKLSLWLKTATKSEPLQNLDKNIKCGNSLIDDPQIAGDKAFDWNTEFADVFRQGASGFEVRDYQNEDREQVASLIFQGWIDSVFIDIDPDLIISNAVRSSVTALENESAKKLVCISKNSIVGYLDLEIKAEKLAFVGDFYVERRFRQQGVGSFLFGRGIEYLIAQGFETLKLYLDDDNQKAHKFYTKVGFLQEAPSEFKWLDNDGNVIATNKEHLMSLDLSKAKINRGGFDVIIGNPPYVNIANIKEEATRKFYQKNFKTIKNKSDLYSIFIEKGSELLSNGGYLSFIVSNSWLGTDSFSKFRKFLIENTKVIMIVKMPSNVFDDATVTPIILILKNEKVSGNHEIELVECIDRKIEKIQHTLTYDRIKNNHGYTFSFEPEIKFTVQTIKLGDIAKFSLGIKTSDDERFILNEKIDEDCFPILRGRDIERYYNYKPKKYIWYKPSLMMEKAGAGPRKIEIFLKEKIFIQDISNSITAILDDRKFFSNDTLSLIYEIKEVFNLRYLLSILNSKIATKWFKTNFPAGLHIKINQLQQLPIPDATSQQQGEIAGLVDVIMDLKKQQHHKVDKFIKLLESELSSHLAQKPLKITKKLQKYYELSFAQFVTELEKQKITLTLTKKSEWHEYFEKEKLAIQELENKTTTVDNEIEAKVRFLYGLDAPE